MFDIRGFLLIYLIGCFPSGLLISRLRGEDITTRGSGNVGATNVARTLGLKYGIVVLLLDAFKGFLGVTFGPYFGVDSSSAMLSVVLGHIVSLPLVLKGGKGVATFLGCMVAFETLAAMTFLVAFGIIFFITRIVSVSSLVGVWMSCFVLAYGPGTSVDSFVAILLTGIVITFAHRQNLFRLIQGIEPKFDLPKRLHKR